MKLTKEQKPWAIEINMLLQFAEKEGLHVELMNPSHPQYQIARLTGDDFRLVVYPHTTRSTYNQHARVRDEVSKDKSKARLVMAKLDALAGFNCTFTHKNKCWGDIEMMINEFNKLEQSPTPE